MPWRLCRQNISSPDINSLWWTSLCLPREGFELHTPSWSLETIAHTFLFPQKYSACENLTTSWWLDYGLKLYWTYRELLNDICYLPLEIGCSLCSILEQMNRSVCLEAHDYLWHILGSYFFNIFVNSNIDSVVNILHKICSMQRILIHIKSQPLCWILPFTLERTWWPVAGSNITYLLITIKIKWHYCLLWDIDMQM